MAVPGSAVDSLSAALKCNIIPNQEYLLQGSVLDQYVEVLLHRLRGLCDNVDSGPESFHDHELCFTLRGAGPGTFTAVSSFFTVYHGNCT